MSDPNPHAVVFKGLSKKLGINISIYEMMETIGQHKWYMSDAYYYDLRLMVALLNGLANTNAYSYIIEPKDRKRIIKIVPNNC